MNQSACITISMVSFKKKESIQLSYIDFLKGKEFMMI